MDIAAAFLQARSFNCEVSVKPPKEDSGHTVLWRPTAVAHELADFGELRHLTSNAALTSTFGLARSKFKYTLYFKNHTN